MAISVWQKQNPTLTSLINIILLKNFYTENSKDSQPLKMGPLGCPKTSLRKYHYLLHNSPEEHSSHLLCGRSLKSRIQLSYYMSKNFILLLTVQAQCIPVNEAETQWELLEMTNFSELLNTLHFSQKPLT
jgi:hypothetical protein